MKIRISRQKTCGSVLLVTIVLCTVLGIMMAGYLSLLNTHHQTVARSDEWQGAMAVAEGGIEEAMAYLNTKNVSTNNLALYGWSPVANGMYQKKCVLGDSFS